MPESSGQKIARLMAEGLDHYGQDQVSAAADCWRAVLELDPRHQVALDYLDAAGFSSSAAAATESTSSEVSLVTSAKAHMDAGDWAAAFEALSTYTLETPYDLDAQVRLELVRSHLHAEHRRRVGDGSGVPKVKMGPEDVLRFNLPANAGFVLSMIDGHTTVSDLVALTGMDPFDALDVFTRLVDAGIVEVQA